MTPPVKSYWPVESFEKADYTAINALWPVSAWGFGKEATLKVYHELAVVFTNSPHRDTVFG